MAPRNHSDDVVHGEVCEVSLAKQTLHDLLRLFKESSLGESWPKARFRLAFVFCLPEFHVSDAPNEFVIDLAT